MAGQYLSDDFLRRLSRALEYTERLMREPVAAAPPTWSILPRVVTVENHTGDTRNRFDIVALSREEWAYSMEPTEPQQREAFKAGRVLRGVVPEEQYLDRWAVLLGPVRDIEADDVDRAECRVQAVVSGVVQAQVDVQQTYHRYATFDANAKDRTDYEEGDEFILQSSAWGHAQILSPLVTTGTQWCYLNLGAGKLQRYFECRYAKSKGSSGIVYPAEWSDEDGWVTDTDPESCFTVFDPPGLWAGTPRAAGPYVVHGTYGLSEFLGGLWHVRVMDCPT
jgi:hypothetical protein